MKELEQAKEKAADLKNSAAAVQKEYDKIMSWADLYAGSSIEGKKMILRHHFFQTYKFHLTAVLCVLHHHFYQLSRQTRHSFQVSYR
mgnify:CR=1 FL=1